VGIPTAPVELTLASIRHDSPSAFRSAPLLFHAGFLLHLIFYPEAGGDISLRNEDILLN
jgi:hypothetical protein